MQTKPYSYFNRHFWLLLVILGMAGGVFVVYGLVAALTNEVWPPIERIAIPLSSGLTLVGTVLTAGSIYVFPNASHPPYQVSKEAVAPFVILSGLIALGVLIQLGALPTVVVNGFSLMAISGGLLRLHPVPLPPEL